MCSEKATWSAQEVRIKASFEGREERAADRAKGKEFQICVQQRSKMHDHHANIRSTGRLTQTNTGHGC